MNEDSRENQHPRSNSFNVRISITKGPLCIALDLPSGVTAVDAIENLQSLVAYYDGPVESPEPSHESSFDSLPWARKRNNNGEWIFANLPEAKSLYIALSKADQREGLVIARYRYKLSQGLDRQFINRWPYTE